MNKRFRKNEKLKSKILIQELFSKGNSLKKFPIQLIYSPIQSENNQVGVSVPKRNFKLAVDRNKLKRLMRESYRLHKNIIDDKSYYYSMMFIYIGKEKAEYPQISSSVQYLLNEMHKKHKP